MVLKKILLQKYNNKIKFESLKIQSTVFIRNYFNNMLSSHQPSLWVFIIPYNRVKD